MIKMRIEYPKTFFPFFILKQTVRTNPVKRRIPAFRNRIRCGRKPESRLPDDSVFILLIKNTGILAGFFSIVPANTDIGITIQFFQYIFQLVVLYFLSTDEISFVIIHKRSHFLLPIVPLVLSI